MTRDEVLALSDEELCAATAIALGWSKSDVAAEVRIDGLGPSGGESALLGRSYWRGPDGSPHHLPTGPYAWPRDIAAAWVLVDKLIEKNPDVDIELSFDRGWMFCIGVDVFAHGPTAPIAITRAFVLVMTQGEPCATN